ncbi:hypothetical protein AGDE_01988 [Angomonas deanei]|uniref:Secreted protein n=1 Tax=Angomonas deanei TaxID=59799 RepID=A0A7G2CNB9_9TRYP|nr:hypothetical protein AGDE_01988 [Angomonas deanei]CAD2221348.1 hypothetical protein, conserved [Angomonas deanei]|eukprot:EPY41935.1 hypothetical protein AGDE_01988 [Angomonas deanei]
MECLLLLLPLVVLDLVHEVLVHRIIRKSNFRLTLATGKGGIVHGGIVVKRTEAVGAAVDCGGAAKHEQAQLAVNFTSPFPHEQGVMRFRVGIPLGPTVRAAHQRLLVYSSRPWGTNWGVAVGDRWLFGRREIHFILLVTAVVLVSGLWLIFLFAGR